MRFAFTDEQEQIRRTASELLADRMPLSAVRRWLDGDHGPAAGLWQELARLGWPRIYVSEEDGGLGLGVVELAILVEQLGFGLSPLPFCSTAAAGLVLREVASPAQKERWLRPVVNGSLEATVALIDGATPARLTGLTIAGTKLAVPNVQPGTLIVVAVDDCFAAVPADAAGVGVDPVDSLDPTRPVSILEFDDASVERLGGSAADVRRVRAAIDAIVAAECVGVAQRALDAAVAYAKERRQFGMQIGAFQAVSHRCAEMLRDVEGARSAAYGAAWACDDSSVENAALAGHIAKAYALDAAVRVCESSIQVHGGVGFTWESHLHLLLRRAQANAHVWGGTTAARAAIAASMGI